MKPHWLLIGGIAVFVGMILYVLFRDRVMAWWTRVSNTEGGKRALEDIGDVEEWFQRMRAESLARKAAQPSPVAAAPIAAADPPAAETSPPTGPAAPSIAESAAPSAIGGTPIAEKSAKQERVMIRTIEVPWATAVGKFIERIEAGETLAFQITPPDGFSSHGKLCSFFQSPSGGDDYYDRLICVSDTAGDFSTKLGTAAMRQGQEAPVYFSVGGYPNDRWGRTNKYSPDLTPGKTYFVNVKQVDPARASDIDYSLHVNH